MITALRRILQPHPVPNAHRAVHRVFPDRHDSPYPFMPSNQVRLWLRRVNPPPQTQVGVTDARVRDADETLAGKELVRLDDGAVGGEKGWASGLWEKEGTLRLGD